MRRQPRIRTRRRLAWLPPSLRRVWPYAKRLHALGTGVIAPATRALGRIRGGQFPRRTVRAADEVAERGEGRIAVARDELHLEREVPAGIPPQHPTFVAQANELVPRVVVAELPGGRVLGPYRAVITARGTLVGELSPYFGTSGPDENPVFVDFSAPPPEFVSGRVGVLAARGDVSYYHFVCDVLPRLALLEQLEDPPELLYVPASLPLQRQLLELLAIDPERIVDSDRIRHLQAETLVVPGLPDADLRTPPWVVAFLRERLLRSPRQLVPGRRLYVTRGRRRGTRIVANEDDVVGALAARGFDVVDPGAMPVADQIATFAQAECVVGPHGAALTNLAFASDGAAAIELFAPDFVQGCYWKLSDSVPGLRYRYLIGAGRAPRGGRMAGVDSDMTVDVDALLRLLEELLGDGAPTLTAPGRRSDSG